MFCQSWAWNRKMTKLHIIPRSVLHTAAEECYHEDLASANSWRLVLQLQLGESDWGATCPTDSNRWFNLVRQSSQFWENILGILQAKWSSLEEDDFVGFLQILCRDGWRRMLTGCDRQRFFIYWICISWCSEYSHHDHGHRSYICQSICCQLVQLMFLWAQETLRVYAIQAQLEQSGAVVQQMGRA